MTSLDLYDFEELRTGMFAKELSSGVTIPYFAYLSKQESHELAVLGNGFLVSGFYKLFGEKGVSLKLCWLFFSIAIYAILFFMMNRYFGQSVAIIISFLYIFSPPFFTWSNLTDTGDEKGALFFIMVITFLNFRILPFRNNKVWHYVIYGFLSGLAVCYNNYCLIVLFVSILYQLWFNWRVLLKKPIVILSISFLVGLSPWIYINKIYNLSWFEPILRKSEALNVIWDKFTKFIIEILPRSLFFKDFFAIKGIILDYTYYFLYILLFLIVIYSSGKIYRWRLKRYLVDSENKELFIYLFIVVYILVYTFGGFRIEGKLEGDHRYLVSLYPFIFMSMAIWLDKILRRKLIMKVWGMIILVLFCVLGLLGNLSMIKMGNDNFKEPSIYIPYSFTWLHYRIYNFTKGDKNKLNACIDTIQAKYSPYACRGIYKNLRISFISNPKSFLAERKDIIEYQNLFYEGMGISVGRFFRDELVFQIELIKRLPSQYWIGKDGIIQTDVIRYFLHSSEYLKEMCKKLSTEMKNFYYKKVGLSIGILFGSQIEKFCKFTGEFEDRFRRSLIEGFGSGLAACNNMEDVIKMGEKIDDEHRKDYFKGAGFTFGLQTVPDLKRIREIGEKIDEEYRDYYYKGIGEAVGWHFTNDPTLILQLVGGRELNFETREYNFLTIGLYQYLDTESKKSYCKGFGYGIAPYLSGYTEIVLDKIIRKLPAQSRLSLLKGACAYYYEQGSGIESCKRVLNSRLSKAIQDIYKRVYVFNSSHEGV